MINDGRMEVQNNIVFNSLLNLSLSGKLLPLLKIDILIRPFTSQGFIKPPKEDRQRASAVGAGHEFGGGFYFDA